MSAPDGNRQYRPGGLARAQAAAASAATDLASMEVSAHDREEQPPSDVTQPSIFSDVSPIRSHRSAAMRSATPIAEILLGWVMIMFASAPLPFKIISSRTSC